MKRQGDRETRRQGDREKTKSRPPRVVLRGRGVTTLLVSPSPCLPVRGCPHRLHFSWRHGLSFIWSSSHCQALSCRITSCRSTLPRQSSRRDFWTIGGEA